VLLLKPDSIFGALGRCDQEALLSQNGVPDVLALFFSLPPARRLTTASSQNQTHSLLRQVLHNGVSSTAMEVVGLILILLFMPS
jgi:hypothetical protein